MVSCILNPSPVWMLVLFTLVNIINYVDRGVVPGAFESLGEYITKDIGRTDTDTFTGALQSAFIGGYSIASISFGHLVHKYPPFKLMSVGLAIWVFAVVLSGLAPYLISHNSFWILIAARVLSGVGEASFQTVIPPWLDDNAPPAKRGLWLSIFYMAIPVGTAIGYGYGGVVSTHLSWEWMFFIEAIPMCPLIALMWVIPYNKKRRETVARVEGEMEGEAGTQALLGPHEAASTTVGNGPASGVPVGGGHHGHASSHHFPHHVPPTADEIQREVDIELREQGDVSAQSDTAPGAPSFWRELYQTLTNPIYMAIVLGYAGFTGVVAGIGTFAPTFIVGLKLIDGQDKASLSAGAVVSIAGLIGVPVGGWLIDYGQRRARAALEREKEIRREARAAGIDENVALAQAAVRARSGVLSVPPSAQLLALSSSASASGLQPDDKTSLLEAAGVPGAPTSPRKGSGPSSSSTGNGVLTTGNNPDAATPNTQAGAPSDDEDATSPEVLDLKLATALPQCAIFAFLGTIFIVGGVFATLSGLSLFLVVLATGTLILMGTTAGINLAMMASVPPETRSFAIGIGTMLLHALGDVPAPPIIGALADKLSPKECDANGNNCTRSGDGLRDTLLATTSWLVWPIILWAVAWILASRQQAWRRATGWYEAQAAATSPNGAGAGSSKDGSYVPAAAAGVTTGTGNGYPSTSVLTDGVSIGGGGSSGSAALPILATGTGNRGFSAARSDAASVDYASGGSGSRQSSQMFTGSAAAGLGARNGGGMLVGSYIPGGGSTLLSSSAQRPASMLLTSGAGGGSGNAQAGGLEMNALPVASSYRAPGALE